MSERVARRAPSARCIACGAAAPFGRIRCLECGRPLVFPVQDDLYRDERCDERTCDRCGLPYRGPAVYCSLECAVDDL